MSSQFQVKIKFNVNNYILDMIKNSLDSFGCFFTNIYLVVKMRVDIIYITELKTICLNLIFVSCLNHA